MTLKQGKLVQRQKQKPLTPQRRDEVSISGHMADPESDDNVLEAAQVPGLYTEAESGEPEKVGMAEEVAEAELVRRMEKLEVGQKKPADSKERVEITSVEEE